MRPRLKICLIGTNDFLISSLIERHRTTKVGRLYICAKEEQIFRSMGNIDWLLFSI